MEYMSVNLIISLNINFLKMTSYLTHNYKKPSYGNSSSGSLRKKVKHFSYSSSDRIGKGFSSIVYKGTNDITNQTVAIKAIDMKGVKDAISREMLDCEIEALTTLNHSNILKCFDVVRETSHCYIVTEFCNEGDLSDLIKKKRRISESEALRILRDIVSGFVEMGDRKFLHRDLKLANIFMNDGQAVIADFGFAKKHVLGSEREKYNVGSPLYMSPEALKRNVYSIKNDIWSIGIMAFEMIHGETPWECRTEKELIEKMTKVPVRFRDSLNVSTSTKDFIRKCLEVDERKRMSLEDLRDWVGQHSSKSSQRAMEEPPALRKPLSNIETLNRPVSEIGNRPLTDIGNRMSSKESGLTTNLNADKRIAPKNSNKESNKENNKENRGPSLTSVPKSIVESNNNCLVIEINTFRLIYKIMEKLKKLEGTQSELIGALGSEVLRRVKALKTLCCDGGDVGKLAAQFGVREPQAYFNEASNPSIKKYKSVVREYFKKYTTEIKSSEAGLPSTCESQVVKHLKSKSLDKELSPDEMLLTYWMVEFAQLSSKGAVKKEYLDSIIDPKSLTLRVEYLRDRVKQLQ